MNEELTTFQKLNSINLNDKTKEKIGLKYLSWAYAWGVLKDNYPDAEYTIYTRKVVSQETITSNFDGIQKTIVNNYENDVPYFTDGKTCYVKIGVTIQGVEYVEYYPVMDNKNNAVRLETVTSTAINKALQRAFVKACARHGLGLYIYAGEDLPEADKVSLDLEGFKRAAEKAQVDAEFDVLKNTIIDLVKKYQDNTDVTEAIYNYVTELFPGKRLSTLEENVDRPNAVKLYSFLVSIDRAFIK